MEHSHRYTEFIIIKPRQSSPLEFQCLHQIAEMGQFYTELHHTNFLFFRRPNLQGLQLYCYD